MAAGSSVQAWATAWLLLRRSPNLQIISVADALIFILCAALGCTIAATAGTLALSQGALSASNRRP